MDIVSLANELEDYIIGQRRYFHRFPEPAWEEVQTTLAIERQLEEMGLEPLRFDDISGVYSYIRGKKAGKNAKTILLRADIDGVSVQEKTGLAFSSENAGMMHACGRDCHIAM
ncbi:M20/M25/M40 family metallo-hydrolase, partial [[Clostridium] symbiosum]